MRRTIVAALLMISPLWLASSASAGAMTYLSLGDSIAFGESTFTQNPSDGNRGYVSLYDQFLGKVYWDKTGVTKGPPVQDPETIGDMLWALMSGPEFQYNH